jgi:xanthine dehydrogenase accessory factor
MAPIVIGLGPELSAPENCHKVIETNRGTHLGRILYSGKAEPNTHKPG